MPLRKEQWVDVDDYKLFQDMVHRVLDIHAKLSLAKELCNISEIARETDYSQLTAAEIMQKINSFLSSNPNETSCAIFLNYLAAYPVSICKRNISRTLALIIGFSYRLSVPTEEEIKKGIKKIDMDDLSEWLGRPKATIYEYVQKTQVDWNTLQDLIQQDSLKEQAKDIAFRELVNEEKERLKLERNNSIKSLQTNKPLFTT